MVTAIAASLALVGISPIALRSLTSIRGINWVKLGDVGQAYGTVSALLVVLGLSGVALSLLLQIRESRHSRVQAARSRQHDLVAMAMGDPVYMAVMSPEGDFDEHRQSSYANLWVQFWLMLWDFGDLTEAELRKVLAEEILSSAAGRRSWAEFRRVRIRRHESRRHRKFYDILDQEYESRPSNAAPARAVAGKTKHSDKSIAAGAGVVVAVVIGVILRRAVRGP